MTERGVGACGGAVKPTIIAITTGVSAAATWKKMLQMTMRSGSLGALDICLSLSLSLYKQQAEPGND